MGLIWLALGAIALWAIIRLGRQTEKPGNGHWRITATVIGAVLMAGAVLAASRGGWLWAGAMGATGMALVVQSRVRPRAGPNYGSEQMSLSEARSILGVTETATAQDIQKAWKRVMARAHPDQGGTEGLAIRVNAARDRLLKS